MENNMSTDKSKTSFLTSGSNGGIDDEYYINEIIGIEDFTYSDFKEKEYPHIDKQLLQQDVRVKL